MNPSRIFAAFLFVVILLSFGCAEKPKPITGRAYTGVLFGKPYSIDVVGDSTDYQRQFDSIIHNFERLFDVNNPASIIAQYNQLTDTKRGFDFEDSTLVFSLVFDLAKDLNRHTLQYYDPTVMPLKREWMVAKMAGSTPNLDSLFEFVGFDGVKVDLVEMDGKSNLRKADKRIELDFADLAKAVVIDHIADFLKSKQVSQFKITCERDVITHGLEVDELNITPMGITSDTTDIKIRLLDAAFSYTNTQDKISLVDPTYGYPVENEMAYVGVIAPTLAEARIFAQAFLIMGIEKASEFYNANEDSKIHSYMFYKDGEMLRNASTNGFDNTIIGTNSDN